MERRVFHLIAAARPNLMKVAPLYHALLRRADWAQPVIVHTGQHYDQAMSSAFFADFGLGNPDVNLEIGSGSHAEQTGKVMIAYERYCLEHRPDWVIVVGDVNSTMACAIVAKKLLLPLAHLEAGLRSRDRTMPEEINRIVTDAIADLLWTPSEDADDNLRSEGVPADRIDRVGNIMIDAYELVRRNIDAADVPSELGLPAEYGVVTLHRPANVDNSARLEEMVNHLIAVADGTDLVFPVHPRTAVRLRQYGLLERIAAVRRLHFIEPLGYVHFMSLLSRAKFAITDSGGIQEETTYIGIPCLTLRETTERPITITQGTNRLVKLADLGRAVDDVMSGRWPRGNCPPLWDGRAADRVVESLAHRLDT